MTIQLLIKSILSIFNLFDVNKRGNEHGVIKGIGVVNCLYFNPEIEQFWVIDYRIYDPENDKKGKIDHVKEMILDIVEKKKIAFKTVLMDSWYSSQTLMALIDNLGKIYYCPLKKNRLVDDTGGVRKYENLENLIWSEQELVYTKNYQNTRFSKGQKSEIPYGLLFLPTEQNILLLMT